MTIQTLDPDRAAGRPWDVVVIGAGPAGALAARQAAAAGLRVLLVDRKSFPRPKVCGACLNGKALAALEAAGLGGLVDRLGGVDLESLELRLVGRAMRIALPAGKALARAVLDAALVEEAIAAGAEFLPETTAAVEPGGGAGRVVRLGRQGRCTTVRARVVVVAAGLAGSCLGREPGLRTRVAAGSRLGAGCTVAAAAGCPDAYGRGTIHMAVGRFGYVGLVRVRGGLLNVAAALDREFVRARGGPGGAAAAVLDEAGAPPVPALAGSSWQGTAALTRRTRPVAGYRLLLIGDAAGYVEPFTGEGIGSALSSAMAAAPLIIRGASAPGWDASLEAAWCRLHRRLVSRRELLCRGLTAALRHPRLARAAFELAARSPAVSGTLVRRVYQPSVRFEAT
jgi:flavin-dependent dehydrogenase